MASAFRADRCATTRDRLSRPEGRASNSLARAFRGTGNLDALGNWQGFDWDPDGGGDSEISQSRTHNVANELATITGSGAADWVDPSHDAAGNMTLAPEPGDESDDSKAQLYVYDAWNRLVEVWHDDGTPTPDRTLTRTGTEADTLLVTYRYDGLNRRIVKLMGTDPANPSEQYDYYYNTSWPVVSFVERQVVEVRKDGSSYPYKQYVWDLRYIDAPVLRWRDHDLDGTSLEETIYYTNDANMNVTALVDASDGSVVERYVYDPYGKVSFYDGSSSDRGSSSYDNEILYCGYRYDPETGLYHVRHRPYHPTLGRWPVRDFEGYIDGMSLYQYAGSSPATILDPSGLRRTKTWLKCGWQRHLWVETQYCCEHHVRMIHRAVCSAFKTVSDTSDALWNYINRRPWTASHDKTRLQFNRFFYRRQAGDLDQDDVNKVQRIFHDLVDELDDPDGTLYKCHDNTGDCAGRLGCAKPYGGYTVHLCHNFFYGATNRFRARIVVHELSHLYQQTSDAGDIYATRLDRRGLPVYQHLPQGTPARLARSKRFTHAATLAKFAMQWYVP